MLLMNCCLRCDDIKRLLSVFSLMLVIKPAKLVISSSSSIILEYWLLIKFSRIICLLTSIASRYELSNRSSSRLIWS